MSENKTRPTDASVEAFLDAVDDGKRSDARVLADVMAEVTGAAGVMWGSSIVGFGSYHYRYASGREGDFLEVGFSPRKRALTIYVMPGFSDYDDLLERLGKHTTGKSCLVREAALRHRSRRAAGVADEVGGLPSQEVPVGDAFVPAVLNFASACGRERARQGADIFSLRRKLPVSIDR